MGFSFLTKFLLFYFIRKSEAQKLLSAEVASTDGFGNVQIKIEGNFQNLKNQEFKLIARNKEHNCEVRHREDEFALCESKGTDIEK